MFRFMTGCALVLTFLWLAGCGVWSRDHSTVPEPVLSGVLKLSVTGADYMNPDIYGRPCPVVIRLYEVPDCEVIRQYRFLDLYNKADHFLGSQLLYVRELSPLHPGQRLQLDLPLVKGAGCLAAFAGYSQFHEGTPSVALPVHGSSRVQLAVEGLRVVMTQEGQP